MLDITTLFVKIDDFYQNFQTSYLQYLRDNHLIQRVRPGQLSMSEIMTIIVLFQSSNYRSFKSFYSYAQEHLCQEFPGLVTYPRFVNLMPRAFIPLFAYLVTNGLGECTGINFIDSTAIRVCRNKRNSRNRVFKGIAKTGKTSMGWFHGFKLHLIINDRGELLAFAITPGNVSDLKPVEMMVEQQNLWGKMFGDKGYISKSLFHKLFQRGMELVTHLRKNMKNQLMLMKDKILLRKRSLIETVNDQLKNVCQIEHSRHRSPTNFFVNLLAALVTYAEKEKKPSLNLDLNGAEQTRNSAVKVLC